MRLPLDGDGAEEKVEGPGPGQGARAGAGARARFTPPPHPPQQQGRTWRPPPGDQASRGPGPGAPGCSRARVAEGRRPGPHSPARHGRPHGALRKRRLGSAGLGRAPGEGPGGAGRGGAASDSGGGAAGSGPQGGLGRLRARRGARALHASLSSCGVRTGFPPQRCEGRRGARPGLSRLSAHRAWQGKPRVWVLGVQLPWHEGLRSCGQWNWGARESRARRTPAQALGNAGSLRLMAFRVKKAMFIIGFNFMMLGVRCHASKQLAVSSCVPPA